MRKTWLVAAATYRRRVRSSTFLLLTFGIPVLMVIAGAIPILTELGGGLPRVGYVDGTGQLAQVDSVTVGDETLEVMGYPDLDAADRAVAEGDIDGFLVIPEDYFEGARPAFHGESSPNARLQGGLATLVREALLPDAPAWQLVRLERPSEITFVSTDTGERVAQGPALIIRVAAPAFLALMFLLAVFMSIAEIGSAVIQEKEQRAMEMVITSLSPRELVAGKVLGMALLSLTQVAVWILGAGVGLGVGLGLSGVVRVQDLSVPWRAIVWAALLGIPGYLLYAVLASGLGIIAGDKQQARQLAGLLGFLGMAPVYFMGFLFDNLGGTLGVGLTLFPLTAPMIALFRMALSEVPTWQLAASLAVMVASVAGSVWFVARIFRAAMLMYGQALGPRQIVRALREA